MNKPRRKQDLVLCKWIVLTAENGWWVSNLYTADAVKQWHESNGHEVLTVIENPHYGDNNFDKELTE